MDWHLSGGGLSLRPIRLCVGEEKTFPPMLAGGNKGGGAFRNSALNSRESIILQTEQKAQSSQLIGRKRKSTEKCLRKLIFWLQLVFNKPKKN